TPSRDVTLADAQFVLAREYSYATWAELVRHVEALLAIDLEQHQRLARDLVTAYHSGDAEAVGRLNELFHSSYDWDQIRHFVERRLSKLSDGEQRIAAFDLADAQLLVARLYGFESWDQFVESSTKPPQDPRSAPFGMSTAPPFYKIDWDRS